MSHKGAFYRSGVLALNWLTGRLLQLRLLLVAREIQLARKLQRANTATGRYRYL